MDIKWKDDNGNIFNANNKSIKYLSSDGTKVILKKEEVKKVTLEEGILCVYSDFDGDTDIITVVPKKNNRDAVKVFNEFDKTGKMLKRKSSNFLLDLILDSSLIMSSPFGGIAALVIIFLGLFMFVAGAVKEIFGEVGFLAFRLLLLGYPIYILIKYILLRIKRAKMKEL